MIYGRAKTRLLLLLLLLLSCRADDVPAQAEEEALKSAPLGAFNGVDIQDRPVTGSGLRGKVVMISVSDSETADAVIEWQTQVGVEAGLALGGNDEGNLLHLAVADVSRFPKLVKPIVKRRLKSVHEKMRRRLLQRFVEKKQSPPADLQDRIYLVPDWTGALVEKLLAGGAQKRLPQLLVVDQRGGLAGRFTENEDASNQQLLVLIKTLFAPSSPN
jgi:hypothetical protein